MEIYVWGTGCALSELIGKELSPGDVAAFVDSFADETGMKSFLGRPVITPEKLAGLHYDLVLVASRHAREIMDKSTALGLDRSRLFFLYNNYIPLDLNRDYGLVRGVLSPGCIDAVKNRCRIIRTREDGPAGGGPEPEEDYVRIRTLQLAAEELDRRGVPGAAAELGVFRGAFAGRINGAFPGRRLYLFDTFQGFSPEEALREKAADTCGDAFIEAHRNAGPERVLRLLPHPENVVIVPGLFPDSLRGLEDTFAFVSLDADFEDSVYAGLRYFYPRMAAGGCIFLHDYNSPSLAGVKKAVLRYEAETGAGLRGVPLCDIGGTLVITA